MNKKKSRDTTVEFMRIIGAIMVIGTHIKLGNLAKGVPVFSHILASCFVGDGVAVFWMILGFFYFRSDNYGKRLKSLVKSILLPLFIYSAIVFFLGDWLFEGTSIAESISHSAEDYRKLLTNLLSWRNVVGNSGHLWFLYTYVLTVIIWPALKGIKVFISQNSKREKWLVVILFAAVTLNYLSENKLFAFSHYSINAVAAASVYVLLGDILYEHRDTFRDNVKWRIAGILAFICVNVLRAFVQKECLIIDSKNTLPIFWYTPFALVAVCGLIIFLFSFSGIGEGRGRAAILHIGSRTFYIYLLHYAIKNVLNRFGVNKAILNIVNDNCYAYMTLYIALIFVLSLLGAEIICFIVNLPTRRRESRL